MAGSSTFITQVFRIGPIAITNTVVMTWAIMLALSLAAWAVTRRLRSTPGPWQVVIEGVVSAIEDSIRVVLPDQFRQVMPFVATLWIFILVANLASLIP